MMRRAMLVMRASRREAGGRTGGGVRGQAMRAAGARRARVRVWGERIRRDRLSITEAKGILPSFVCADVGCVGSVLRSGLPVDIVVECAGRIAAVDAR